MDLSIYPVTLSLRETFKIAHDQRDSQASVIVSLRQGRHIGYGEATANPFYGVSQAQIVAALAAVQDWLSRETLINPETLHQQVAPRLGNSFALSALDQAAYDLHGQLQGIPTRQLWDRPASSYPLSNYTIGIADIPAMVAKLKATPWPLYKIKLGTDHDLEIVRALREHTDARFRVDANCAWTPEQTLSYAKELAKLGVEFIEQPLAADAYEEMAALRPYSALPLIADESCIVESDVARCAPAFHGINIKLPKCGGMTVARRMIAQARQQGMQVMLGCMTESSVGISAIAQLLPLLDYVDMDGAMLLSNDPAQGVRLEQGVAQYPSLPGHGVQLKPGFPALWQ